MSIQGALEIARENDEHIDRRILKFLETAFQLLWDRILDDPEGYVMNRDEFALFNFYRHLTRNYQIARNAVKRFWNHYTVDDK